MSVSELIDALSLSMRNLFRPQVTEPLPWKTQRVRSERYRASFGLVMDDNGDEACIGCMMCEKICPSEIITVTKGGKRESPNTGKKRGWADDFTLDLNACIICELCVQVCPTDAILMLRVQEAPSFDRNGLMLTMEKLYKNGASGNVTWGSATKLLEMQDPNRPDPVAIAAAEAAAAEKAAEEAADKAAAQAAAEAATAGVAAVPPGTEPPTEGTAGEPSTESTAAEPPTESTSAEPPTEGSD